MKILDIEQRPDKELMLRCHCGGDHFLIFSAYFWPTNPEPQDERYWDVNVIDTWAPSHGLFYRIRGAFDLLRGKYVDRSHSVGLNNDDVVAVREWCDSLLLSPAAQAEQIA